MKKLLVTTAISTVILGTSAYACTINECNNSCVLNECGNNAQCIVIEGQYNNGCNGLDNVDLENIKQQIINSIGLPEYTTTPVESTTYVTETPTETTTAAIVATTVAQTENTTNAYIEPTTQATTNAYVEPTTQATTNAYVEPTTQTTTNSYDGSNNVNASFAQQVLDLVNTERVKNGLGKLSLSAELNNVAQAKAEDMLNNNYFSHTSPTYGSPFDMMKSFGVKYNAAAENIAKGQSTPQKVVTDWLNSEGHRKNILNGTYTKMGLGFAKGNTTYWSQMFTN